MATEKDTAMGDLEACADVFADLMNVLMFQGEAYVREEDLEQGREKSSYESDKKTRVRPQYRDRFFSIAIFFNTRFTKYVFSYMYAISATKCTNEEILIISIYFSIHVHRAQLFSRYS